MDEDEKYYVYDDYDEEEDDYGDDVDGDEDNADNLCGYICHGYVSKPTKAPLLFDTQSAKFRRVVDAEANVAFCDWMMNNSPVRNFILNDDLSSLMDGGVIIDAQRAGPSTLLWICKAFRVMNEEQHRVPIWHKLVKLGVNPMLALCASHCVRPNLLAEHHKTHCSIFIPPTTKEEVKKICTIDHIPECPDGLKNGTNYTKFNTSSLFSKLGEDGYGCGFPENHLLPIAQNVKTEMVDDGWGGFSKKQVGGTVEELAAGLIKLEKECV